MTETKTPQQLSKVGKAAYQRGDFMEAAHQFEAAGQGYLAQGDAVNAAEMANNCSVAYLQAGEAEAALQVVQGTDETFAAAGDLRRQGMAVGNRGAALEGLGRNDEALAAYEKSAELLKQAGDDASYSSVMQSLSALQLKTGKQLQALSTMQAGLNAVEHPSPKQRLIKRLLTVPFKLMNKG